LCGGLVLAKSHLMKNLQFMVEMRLNRTIDFAAKNQFVEFSILIFTGLIFAPLFIKEKWKN
jgi:hypothetical protein